MSDLKASVVSLWGREEGTPTFTDMVTTLWTVIKLQHRVRDEEGKVNQKMGWQMVGLLDSECHCL